MKRTFAVDHIAGGLSVEFTPATELIRTGVQPAAGAEP